MAQASLLLSISASGASVQTVINNSAAWGSFSDKDLKQSITELLWEIKNAGIGGSGLPGTNTVIAYGSSTETNASGTFTGTDLVASNANGSVTFIGGSITTTSGSNFLNGPLTVNGVGGSTFYGDNNLTNYLKIIPGMSYESNAVGRAELNGDSINSTNRLTGSSVLITNGSISTTVANKAALISSNVTTSPYLWTNPLPYNVVVYVSQGTNNGIAQNGSGIGFFTNTCTTLICQPNDYVWVTNNGGRPNFLIKPL
jgi:hypothetical protein